MFGEVLGLLIFLLTATFLPGFPASPLYIDCTVNSCIPPPRLFSPPLFLGRPAHIFSCLQQTGLQLSSDLFCSTDTSAAWGRLCGTLIEPLAFWGVRSSGDGKNSWGKDVSMEITDQQVMLLGDLLARYNLGISRMLTEGFYEGEPAKPDTLLAKVASEHALRLHPPTPSETVFLVVTIMLSSNRRFHRVSRSTCFPNLAKLLPPRQPLFSTN